MRATKEAVMYVHLDSEDNLAVLDGIESSVNATMTGDRQILVSVEELSDALDGEKEFPERIAIFISEILIKARLKSCSGDVLIYV